MRIAWTVLWVWATLAVLVLCVFALVGRASTRPTAETDRRACIDTVRIRTIVSVNPNHLDFIMQNGRVFRNSLRNRCMVHPGTGFRYRTMGTRLCNGQFVHSMGSGARSCQLGPFHLMPRGEGSSPH